MVTSPTTPSPPPSWQYGTEQSWKTFGATYAVPIAATTAAGSSVIVGYPFDSLKTRMQVFEYASMLDCVRKTHAAEGLGGFYRGVLPVLASVSVFRSISFSLYHSARSLVGPLFAPVQQDSLMGLGTVVHSPSSLLLTTTTSGVFAGSIIATLSAPLELIKVQRQLASLSSSSLVVLATPLESTPPIHKSALQWASSIYRTKGLKGFYSGYGLHLGRDTLGTAVYFSVYESARMALQTSSPLMHMLSGGLAGSIVWIIMFPIDMYVPSYSALFASR